MAAQSYIRRLIIWCGDILDGAYGSETEIQIHNLMVEMDGFRHQLSCTRSQSILNDETLDGVRKVRGWLTANMASLTGLTSSTTITATADASSSSTVTVQIRQSIDTVRASECLSQEDKDSLELAIHRLDEAARDKDERGFAEKLKTALDLAQKGVNLIPSIVKVAGMFADSF